MPCDDVVSALTLLHTEQLRFENAPWSREPYMLELAVLEFRLDLLSQRQLASDVAKQVTGVKDVINEIEVK